MAYTTRELRTVYDAVISRLETSTSKVIGDHIAPLDLTLPYAVVYHRSENIDDIGTLSDPTVVAELEWQVTSVGETREQAQWMSYKVRQALNGFKPVVSGMSFSPIILDGDSPVTRDDDVQPPKFYAVDIFTTFVN